MRKIKKVKIEGFWGTRTVTLNFNDDINFLIGVNGSGKTTMINLIAASLNADFATLDKAQFSKIRVDFFDLKEVKEKTQCFIEVEKTVNENSPYSNIIFKIKLPDDNKPKIYKLNELEEESFFRYPNDYIIHKRHRLSGQLERDVNIALKDIVNLTWLSIHRTTGISRTSDEKSFESTIDKKINELSTDLVKYFGILDKRYSLETEKFQKNIFLSLIEDETQDDILSISKELDSEKEKDSLKQIFLLFKLKENDFSLKLQKHFKSFEAAKDNLKKNQEINLNHLAAFIGTRRVHSIVQEWNTLNEIKTLINKPKFTFLSEINCLFQGKKISINERNELFVETQSGKTFPLIHLSSGEKQLIIILGQSLLQENNNHIYIADEPELSLHVEWQEKLVSSLKSVNPNSQIIFATHSPDIVGKYSDSVINVEEVIK